MTTDDERREAGMRTRREVLGDAWVDRAVANTTSFSADFQDFITRTAWGDVWQRPGLARRDRSLLTLAITVALRHWDEFALHVRAAKNNGLTDEEIGEVIQHAAIYAGVPPDQARSPRSSSRIVAATLNAWLAAGTPA